VTRADQRRLHGGAAQFVIGQATAVAIAAASESCSANSIDWPACWPSGIVFTATSTWFSAQAHR
jgi:hypothetical protein